MTSYLTSDALTAEWLPEYDIDLPTGRGMVRARVLSRLDVIELRKVDRGLAEFEAALIAAALVEPKMTAEAVTDWQRRGPSGEFEHTLARVMAMSGLNRDAGKAAWKELQSDPDAEFRAVPSPRAGYDGDGAAGDDAEQ